MNTEKVLTIYKGDDTGGSFGKRLVITVNSTRDLTGCIIVFNYQGVTRRFEDVTAGQTVEVFFSHNETAKMTLGTFRATIFSVDPSGKICTLENALPIKVTNNLKECYGDAFATVTIGTAVNWDNITNKPFEGVEVDLSTDDKKLAALGTIIEKLGGTVKTFAIFALSALAGLSGFAYEPEANTNSFTRSGVTYAQRGGLGNSSYVVTNVQMSAGDVGAVPDDSAYAAATNRALTVDGSARPLPPYLHLIDFDDSYTNSLEDAPVPLGGCSSFRNGNWYGRTYDWKYTHAPSFVVRMSANEDRFASLGVASVGDALTEDEVALGRFSPLFKALPCMTLDGINSEGVFANINVVATNGNDAALFTGDYPALACVRYVLDHFGTAFEAAKWIAENAKIPQAALDAGYSFHWMIGDDTYTFVVEDGEWSPVPANAMTNFRLLKQDEPYGSGHERYAAILAGIDANADPKAICKSVWFREAYRRPFTRPTEFAGSEDANGRIPYTATARLLAWAEENVPQGAPESLKRNGRSWQSVHSSVYDIRNRQLIVAVQEVDDWYVFGIAGSGRVKSVNGKTGHVVLDADDVGAYSKAYTDAKFLTTNLVGMTLIAGSNTVFKLDAGTRIEGTDDATYRLGGGTLTIPDNLNVTVRGDRTLATWAITNALENDEEWLATNENFKAAVERVSPPVELPEKWALANVTNASGTAANVLLGEKRDLTNNTCRKTEYGEWEFSGSDVEDGKTYSIRIFEGEIYRDYDLFIDDVYSGDTLEEQKWYQIRTEVKFPEKDITATRTAVCVSNELYTTYSFVTNAVNEAKYVPSATDPMFSNAVLAVQIDTNVVSQIGELKQFFDELPVGTAGTSLGGIVLALLGAAAWLKKSKVGKLTATDTSIEVTAEDGVADVADFFSESNSLLTGTIASETSEKAEKSELPIPLVAKTGDFTTESYKRFVVASMPSAGLALTMHTPTGTDADVFECRFDGTALTADASVTFTGATVTKMEGETDTGVVKAGKVALMSAFWNGATWDVNWKVEG